MCVPEIVEPERRQMGCVDGREPNAASPVGGPDGSPAWHWENPAVVAVATDVLPELLRQ